ncbi:hypothetical protein ACHAWO_013749 [Cyclotella atomus]|uniref:Uncharacterized protein n=1 Tax=Cyclotella atomus TaxID=382360 RepID=A0ABD3NPG9_9STRA
MAINISNCNLCYPKLIVNPSYGDAMRFHAEYRDGQPALDDVEHYPDSFQRYITMGIMEVRVDWGPVDSSHVQMLSDYIIKSCMTESNMPAEYLAVELTVNRIGCRPAMALLASSTGEVRLHKVENKCTFSEMQITWNCSNTPETTSVGSPEYLITLKILHHSNQKVILRRTLHAVPPPIGPLQYHLHDIVWAPKLFGRDEAAAAETIHTVCNNYFRGDGDEADQIPRRRRGFGLELETVRMPLTEADFEADCYTQQQEFEASIERARKWHLSSVKMDSADEYEATIGRIDSMWDQLLLWSVSHDLYVENAAAPSRIDLYQRIRAHVMDPINRSDLSNPENEDLMKELAHLVLGGKPMPQELSLVPYDELPISQASPEYKSPLPPNELYHEFPAPLNGRDQADAFIRLFLEGVLKNPSMSTKPVAVPLVSDLGQSATSIHVHVNVTNPTAWPRDDLSGMSDIERTQSLLCVVFAWICFDRVVQNNVCMPNVWRDRSFAPMLPTGPEFVWKDLAWDQGSSIPAVNDDGVAAGINVYNFPAWFCHVHKSYNNFLSEYRDEKKEARTLFDTVFDSEVMKNTISRWNSLNLLPINCYGTIEFRRMHASLNADFVSAWTWFCVGFVERFSSQSMFDEFLHPYLKAGKSWEQCLESLSEAQNMATIEDLIDIMSNECNSSLPINTFDTLMSIKHRKVD